ncbi:MAG: hypothetical protein Q4G30_07610 [Actinomycetaceae bacterium]|nr:hypothetical protein [Actinomycetaceae bacterium]
MEKAQQIWEGSKGIAEGATQEMRSWFRSVRHDAQLWALREYKHFTPRGELYRRSPLGKPKLNPKNPGFQYVVVGPDGQEYSPPTPGWRCKFETFADLDARGLIDWRYSQPAQVLLLTEYSCGPPADVFTMPRRASLPFTKPVKALVHWWGLIDDDHARIIEPYAGTGTGMDAVRHLNDTDQGQRTWLGIELDPKSVKATAGY